MPPAFPLASSADAWPGGLPLNETQGTLHFSSETKMSSNPNVGLSNGAIRGIVITIVLVASVSSCLLRMHIQPYLNALSSNVSFHPQLWINHTLNFSF